jgi:hypothetical protein
MCPSSIFGDNAHAPYGVRDPDDIFALTCAAVERLWAEGCDLVILACNTASAAALKRMQETWVPPDKRVLGVFVPLIEALTERQWGDNSPPARGGGQACGPVRHPRHRGQPRVPARTGVPRHRGGCRGAALRRRGRCHRTGRRDPGRGAGAQPCRGAEAPDAQSRGRDPRLHALPADGEGLRRRRWGRGSRSIPRPIWWPKAWPTT